MRLIIHFLVMLTVSIVLLVAAVLGARAIVVGKAQYSPRAVPETLLPVETVIWKEQTEQPIVSGYGVINSRHRLELRAEVNGRIMNLAPEMKTGGRVASGQTLLVIDPFDYQTAVDEAELQLEEINLSLSELEAQRESERALLPQDIDQNDINTLEFKRQATLQQKGVSSASALDAARRQLNVSRQSVAARQQQIRILTERIKQKKVAIRRQGIAIKKAKSEFDKTTLFAPFSGLLANVSVERGQLVGRNEALGELIDPEELEVRFNLSQDEFAVLSSLNQAPLGAYAKVIWSYGQIPMSTPAQITRISPVINDSQGGLELFAVIGNPEDNTARNILPRPGTFAEVQVSGQEIKNAVSLPITALSGQNKIYVVGSDGILSEVQVQVFERRGNRALVTGNLPEGSRVVAARFPRLAGGLKVRDLSAPNPNSNPKSSLNSSPNQDHTKYGLQTGTSSSHKKAS